MSKIESLQLFLDEKAEKYNQPSFIPNDPICIPHAFSKQQDIEIAGFFAAILAWGLRKTIISKCNELMNMMGNEPHRFMIEHSDEDLKGLSNFKHRTFNTTDLLYFIHFFRKHYETHESLEAAFIDKNKLIDSKSSLAHFHDNFFDDPFSPDRTRKHIATPIRNSACKRINMYLRWMVRSDNNGVDFGLWKNISPAKLVCPLDVHVSRTARKLGLITRKQDDWKTATELTHELTKLDSKDPVKYDFALFGLGVMEKF